MLAATNILEWALGKLPTLIFVLFVVSQIVRGILRARRENPRPLAKPDELEAQRRVQEVQEQIRRRISERRGTLAEPPLERNEPLPEPLPRRVETTQMPEPFGGPLRRVFEEIQREVRPQTALPPAPPPPLPLPAAVETRHAELERQEHLTEELRVLEESRVLVKRRATKLAAASYAETQSEGGIRSVARGKLLDDLREPESLRRAFVLREVLGPPVGLR